MMSNKEQWNNAPWLCLTLWHLSQSYNGYCALKHVKSHWSMLDIVHGHWVVQSKCTNIIITPLIVYKVQGCMAESGITSNDRMVCPTCFIYPACALQSCLQPAVSYSLLSILLKQKTHITVNSINSAYCSCSTHGQSGTKEHVNQQL